MKIEMKYEVQMPKAPFLAFVSSRQCNVSEVVNRTDRESVDAECRKRSS